MPSQAGDGKQNTENMEYNEIDPNEDTQSMLRNLTNESKGIYSSKRQRSPEITNNTDNGKKVKNVQSEPTTSSSKSENTKADIWKYSQHDKGPYIFFIKKKERTEKPISILEICRLMKTLCLQYKAISNENNKWTWKVTFDSKYTANLLLTDQRVAEKGYRAFITQELLFRKIVIRDIPTDITKDELKKDLMIDNGRIEIQDIYRLQRKNQKKELVPTESVCVTIRSRELPRDINMWRAKLSFQPYIQSIRQCFKCGKLYYSIKFCTAPEAKCLNCGKQVHGTCQNVSNCINCGGPHKTLDNSCVKVQESKEINKIR
ncbi:uncharacterized protein LOC122856370 [Aphidius gifuensis]|uniref:uncharacterized protein LOC122856370 n=1 Tax=Aphidius gifuensis TaxID=684658 RepID=UPI001CDD44F2|nr:uncharacterized protein LOC122856370 [Aphidius gifuensis]